MGAFHRDEYDVVIAGGSFAGLAVATQLRGRVLLVDHNEIGEGQTSACGTTEGALRAVGALDTVQQVHDTLVLHLAPAARTGQRERTLTYPLPYRFCTFDYRALCRLLADRARGRGVEIARARATGWRDAALHTDEGAVGARLVVDATGCRAAVASSIAPGYVRRDQLSAGLEAELPQPAANHAQGLRFWAGLGTVWPGYAWSFPAGPVSRLGVIAYSQAEDDDAAGLLRWGRLARLPAGTRSPGMSRGSSLGPSSAGSRVGERAGGARPGENANTANAGGASKGLREVLDAFLDGPGAAYWSPDGMAPWTPGAGRPTAGRHLHGGFLPAAPRPTVVGPVFSVGDAAGRCFALTGEGIRPALAQALECGRLLQGVLDGHLTAGGARARYRRYGDLRVPYWHLMRLLQWLVAHMTDRGLARYSLAASPSPMFRFLMRQYLLPAPL